MAMSRCPECGHEISTRAEVCPNCGRRKLFDNSIAQFFIVLAIVIGALMAYFWFRGY